MGSVIVDWLEREWIRGTRGDERFSITLPSFLPALPSMFATDLSNRTPASLFPKVIGQHPRASYELDNTVGTISQTDTRVFNRGFNNHERYPSSQQVSDDSSISLGLVY